MSGLVKHLVYKVKWAMSRYRVTAIAACKLHIKNLSRVSTLPFQTHHADEAGGIIAIEEKRVEPAEKWSECPCSLEESNCCQRKVDRTEEQIGDGEANHEDGGGLGAQLPVPDQADHCDQVAEGAEGGENACQHPASHGR